MDVKTSSISSVLSVLGCSKRSYFHVIQCLFAATKYFPGMTSLARPAKPEKGAGGLVTFSIADFFAGASHWRAIIHLWMISPRLPSPIKKKLIKFERKVWIKGVAMNSLLRKMQLRLVPGPLGFFSFKAACILQYLPRRWCSIVL